MHKLFLTSTECGIINGANKVIEAFGGFPSMENGRLISIEIMGAEGTLSRYNISLLFDVQEWIRISQSYADKEKDTIFSRVKSNKANIRLTFERAEGIKINSDEFVSLMNNCGEIKFTNKHNPDAIQQDCVPTTIPILERPFCGFGIRFGKGFFIEFLEEECIISASLE